MKYLHILLIIMLTITACTDNINLEQLKGESCLVVYAFPTTQDTFEIKISATRPNYGSPSQLTIEQVSCNTNGIPDKVVYCGEEEAASIPIVTFRAIGRHKSGDIIEVKVRAKDFPEATASTQVPTRIPIEKVSADTTYYKGNMYTRIKLQFHDNEENEFFAVRIIGDYMEMEGESPNYEFLEIETSAEPILNQYSNTETDFGTWNNFYHKMYVFDNSSFHGKEVTMQLYILQKTWIANYRPQLFALSSEYGYMLKSLNNTLNNELGNYGLSFVYASYTNVNGGYGCVAGYTLDEGGGTSIKMWK